MPNRLIYSMLTIIRNKTKSTKKESKFVKKLNTLQMKIIIRLKNVLSNNN